MSYNSSLEQVLQPSLPPEGGGFREKGFYLQFKPGNYHKSIDTVPPGLYDKVIMDNFIPDRKTTRLTDGKILLRPYEKRDLDGLHQATLASLKELILWMPWACEDYPKSNSRYWIKSSLQNWQEGQEYNFAICDTVTGGIIGGAGINEINIMNKCANLGYWVRSDRTGQGIAVASTKMLARWGFEVLKLNRIEIHVAVDNTRSLRVAEKAGAKREGILRNKMLLDGKIHDSVMHSLIPGEA
jgi:ribosomal-protein-serine acetyltransferase